MRYRTLWPGGPRVSALGFGAMSFGGVFGATSESESLACLDAMYEAGITFVDTANIYGMGCRNRSSAVGWPAAARMW